MYYRGAAAAVIVFDVSKDLAWTTIKTWHKDLLMYAEPGVVICVAGNKIDMPGARSFDQEECLAACTECGATLHLTSACTGEGINDLFFTIAKRSAACLAAQQKQREDRMVYISSESSSQRHQCCYV